MRTNSLACNAEHYVRSGPISPKELTLADVLSVLRRRRTVLYSILFAVTAVAGLYCIVGTRRYQATGTLQVLQGSADALDLQSLVSGKGNSADALEGNIDLQTKANILQSDTLATQTINELQLEKTPEFRSRLAAIGLGPHEEPAGASWEQSPRTKRRMLKSFHANLTVRPITGTRVIAIDYRSRDPKRAADVVNSLMSGLVEYTFRTQNEATGQTSEWLKGQLANLRKRSEELQANVVNLQREAGVYNLGTLDSQGREQAYSRVLDQLQQDTGLLTQARQNRILKEAIARAAENGNAEMLSGLAGNGSAQAMNNSLAVIQALRQREAAQTAAVQEAEAKYDKNYPKLQEMEAELGALRNSIREEVERIRGRAQSDFEIARHQETANQKRFDETQQQAAKLNDKAIEFAIVRQEADQSRQLYEDLLKRLNEAGILKGLRSSNIVVVDKGQAPDQAKTPNIPVVMLLGVAAGLLLGCFASFILDGLDNSIKTIDDVEEISKLHLLGAIPFAQNTESLSFVGTSVVPPMIEHGVRGIQTLLLTGDCNSEPRVIMVTSPNAGEGKTTVSVTLARLLAEYGHRVLLVDTNLNGDGIRHALELTKKLVAREKIDRPMQDPEINIIEGQARLSVLLATKVATKAALSNLRSLGALLTEWRATYDFIILDSAPLLQGSNTMALSRMVDTTVLLVKVGYTRRTQLERCMYLFGNREGEQDMLVVANGVRSYDPQYSAHFTWDLQSVAGVN